MQVEIKRLGINGEGIGYIDRKAIFIANALPGEIVEYEIIEDKKTYFIGKLINIIQESQQRVSPFCPVYEECGGCQLQHLKYDQQLIEKRELIIQALKRYVGSLVKFGLVEPMIGMDQPTHYRNKASLPIQYINNKTQMGLYKPGTNHFVAFERCPIHNEDINKLYRLILNQMAKRKIDASNRGGVIRYIIIRKTHHNKETQVSFIVTKKDSKVHTLAKYLVNKLEEVKSVYEVINTDFKSRDFFTKRMTLLAGDEVISESLNETLFKLKPDAFFQLNTKQAQKLYEKVVEVGQFSKQDVVVDAFGGVGPLAFYIAPHVFKVYSIDKEKSSIESLKQTIKSNNVENIIPLLGDVKTVLNEQKIKGDVFIFDPPRTGLGKAFCDFLLKHKPKKLIYISCNPSTLAKDLSELLKIYEVKRIIPYDFFPQTSHVESLTLLTLK
ncbi:MAG: 23S rRNA (uracil(1939)-C(5))-methyltransferase RlmD [Acholeplasmataceae bacterium]